MNGGFFNSLPMNIEQTSCCGVHELINIGDERTAHNVLLEVAKYRFYEENPCALYFFTGVTRGKYAEALAALIKKEKLGTCTRTRPKKNPNSGNTISAYLWDVNNTKFKSWWVKNRSSQYAPDRYY